MQAMGDLTNDELLAQLAAHVGSGHVWQARLIAYLAEVEERRLHLEAACSSMFDFCVHRLDMSDGEAHRRLIAARLVRRFPSVLGYLERGDVHLCGLALLRDHLTDDNHEELLHAASGKTVRAVQEMLAARAPKPDVPSRIEPLAPQADLPIPAPATQAAETSEPRPRVEPLSASRYRVELTVSGEVKEKLEVIKDLMRHRNPTGDLEVIVEQALDLLLAKLEKERLGKGARPRKRKPPVATEQTKQAEATPAVDDMSRHVPQDVRREVFERDGMQCTYVDAHGRRCACRAFLELDHVIPFARGGKPTVDNLRVRCRPHNLWYAEQTFGRDHIEEQIHLRRRKCEGLEATPFAIAARGLKNLGFRDADVRRVLAALEANLDGASAPVETIVREALVLLT
jgi:5-methylcytosine-specific restriction endonuclease McrA